MAATANNPNLGNSQYAAMLDWYKASPELYSEAERPNHVWDVPGTLLDSIPVVSEDTAAIVVGAQRVTEPLVMTGIHAGKLLSEVASWFKQVRGICFEMFCCG